MHRPITIVGRGRSAARKPISNEAATEVGCAANPSLDIAHQAVVAIECILLKTKPQTPRKAAIVWKAGFGQAQRGDAKDFGTSKNETAQEL